MRLVTVLADKGTCIIFLTAASPRSSRQMSLVEGKINSSPMVNGFFALAIRLATKNDALNAFSFIDVVTFRNFSCPSCSRFFLSKYSRGLSFDVACLLFKWRSSFDGFIDPFESRSPQSMQSGVGAWVSPVAINPYFK